jgi:hypothetical protein
VFGLMPDGNEQPIDACVVICPVWTIAQAHARDLAGLAIGDDSTRCSR